MNKVATVIIVIALVILGLFGFLYLRNSRSLAVEDPVSQEPQVQQNSPETLKTTFIDLLKLGKDYSCTFDYTDDSGNATTGKVYIAGSGDKMSGAFILTQNDGTVADTNIIRDGDYMYMWSSALAQGFKSKITTEDGSSLFGGSIDTDSVNTPNTSQPVDFNCSPWIVNDSMFVPPSDVAFVDVSEQMKQIQEQYGGDKCAACDQFSEESKAQCLVALSCN